MADLTGLEALRQLVGAAPFDQQDELDFEHYRWSVYERALSTADAERALLGALREEPDPVVARAALWELVERPLWVDDALSVLAETDVDHPVRQHAREVRILRAPWAGSSTRMSTARPGRTGCSGRSALRLTT